MKQRIWELDALRGLCILGMVLVHICFDLILFDIFIPSGFWAYTYLILTQWGGILFFLISGISVTLGSHPVKRGSLVFLCGMVCTLVTASMYWFGIMGKGIVIYFGVLHCLGICMLLWPLLKKLPLWALAALGAITIGLGFYFQALRVDTQWLMFLGLRPRFFATSDYFPIFPNIGYFLMGTVLGLTLYRKKTTLLPRIHPQNLLIRFLRLCGRHSLPIYLLHQPLVYALIYGYALWRY